jgi:SNF2 family DNA or RNA helicase
MAHLDYKDGYFCGIGTYEEREIWKKAGFTRSAVRKCWITTDQVLAEQVKVPWTDRALRHVEEKAAQAELSAKMSYADTTDFRSPVPNKIHPVTGKQLEPFRYQDAGVEYCLPRTDALIADQPGLGKTLQGILLFNADEKIRQVLIVSPAGLKIHWKREFDLWKTRNVSVGIAEAKRKELIRVGTYKNGKNKYKWIEEPDFWPNTDVVVINYHILERFADKIKGHTWDLLICDEAHALKTIDSSRTLHVLGGTRLEESEINGRTFKKRVRYEPIAALRRLFLTGTPIMNRPIELWPMVQAFDPEGLGKDYLRFVYRYCDAFFDSSRGPKGALNVLGASYQEELGQKLREAFMIRRLRSEVQSDLPEKQRRVIIIDSPDIRALVMKEDELTQALGLYENTILKGIEEEHERDAAIGTMVVERARLMGLDAALGDPDKPNFSKLDVDYIAAITGLQVPEIQIIFEQIATVRRDLGLAKMSATVPWIKDFLDGGDKLVVFAYHTDVVKGLAEELRKYNPAVIWGGTPPHKRQAEVDKFQDDESCRVIILNIDAGGVGYTLTRAKDVAFVEGDWVPSKLIQAFDRICRIGQLAAALMGYFLVADGSLDCRIAQSSQMKEENIDRILDS